jgi:hypothetical protein
MTSAERNITGELASDFRGLEQRSGALAATISAAISDWLWNPFAQEQRGVLESRAESFEALARLVAGVPAAEWWASSFDPEAQVLLGSSTVPPSTALVDRSVTTTEPIALHQLTTTSTFVDDELPAAQLADIDLSTRLPAPIGLWRLRPQAGARVYEVQRLADWLTLCDDHPRVHPVPDRWRRAGASGRLGISPDWRAVAEDWDGVHFSMTGVLGASDVALTLGAYAIVPPTLETEVTFWFRHEFRDVALLDVWNGDLPD